MRAKTILSAVILTAALAGCRPANPVLEIEGGKIQGVESSVKGVYIYKGIPFAAPPVGDLRWKEPQPVIPWEGVKMADTFGPASVQVNHDSSNPWTSEFYWEDPEFSEDCLYLNVFGFLVHPFLTEESPNHVSGNYGLLDQIAALKWVHANIAAFGGDPDDITILGQSAGAGSVKALVSSPLTGDLIKKAIIQSGGGVNVPPAGAPAPAQPAAPAIDLIGNAVKGVFDWAGYDTLEKMRAASTEEIFTLADRYAAETGTPFRMSARPVIDGYVSMESFDAAALEGRIKDIPYMIGYTRDDLGDSEMGIRRFCELRNEAGKPVYAYQFAHALPDDEAGSHDMKGAFHSSELWYMFKSLDRGDRPFTQADWDLAEHVVSCWTNFAKTGDPGLGWNPYTIDNPEFMVFDLSEDGSEDASAMGAPLKRRQ